MREKCGGKERQIDDTETTSVKDRKKKDAVFSIHIRRQPVRVTEKEIKQEEEQEGKEIQMDDTQTKRVKDRKQKDTISSAYIWRQPERIKDIDRDLTRGRIQNKK